MKRTQNINIASRLFSIDEDAYLKLDEYLVSIKNHFKNNADRDNVMSDIEERISEHFLESKTGIINSSDVDFLIKTMGTVEQFDKEEGEAIKRLVGPKQLHRDSDNVIIAGVASGLAHYFGIDPLIMRIIFLASVLAGGTGILIYVILWLILPEAKTASQKLLMHGEAVTLGNLSEIARARINEIKVNKNGLARLIFLPFKVIGNVIRFFLNVLPKFARAILGFVLSIVGVGVLVWTMVAGGFAISSDILVFDEVSLREFIPGIQRYVIILGVMFTIMIPALFALLAGISLFKKKYLVKQNVVFGIIGAWLIALTITGFGTAKTISGYENLISTSPSFQETTRTIEVEGNFNQLYVQNNVVVEIIEGSEVSLLVSGASRSINDVSASVNNESLVIERNSNDKKRFCLLCFVHSESVRVTLTVPSAPDSITISHGSKVTGELSTLDELTLNIENSSRGEFKVSGESVEAKLKHGSRLVLTGNLDSADVSLENSSTLNASDLNINDLIISARNGSRAEVDVEESLDATAINSSVIIYYGEPEVTKNVDVGSKVYSLTK